MQSDSVNETRLNFNCRTISAAYAVAWFLSVRLSVCHVRVFCRNEHIYIFKYFHYRIATPF